MAGATLPRKREKFCPIAQAASIMPRLLRQFGLELTPALFQSFRLSFRRGDDLLRQRCEQCL
jgi:hypothetical protein